MNSSVSFALVRRANRPRADRCPAGPTPWTATRVPLLRCGPIACRGPCRNTGRRGSRRPRGRARVEQLSACSPSARSRHRVAAVEQRVNRDARHAPLGAQIDQREQVLVDRVHAAVADEAHEVHGAAVLRRGVARVDERRIREKRSVANRLADANEVLHHHSAGTEVEVAHLAVSHLPLGQSHGEPRRVEQRAAGCARPARPMWAWSPARSRCLRAPGDIPSHRAPPAPRDVWPRSIWRNASRRLPSGSGRNLSHGACRPRAKTRTDGMRTRRLNSRRSGFAIRRSNAYHGSPRHRPRCCASFVSPCIAPLATSVLNGPLIRHARRIEARWRSADARALSLVRAVAVLGVERVLSPGSTRADRSVRRAGGLGAARRSTHSASAAQCASVSRCPGPRWSFRSR